ncbi:MAG: hypothetical protein HN344_10760, partial [Gammaproteobacteria bacterium]|nr:hypothetical protein [Gammaproteobacteria bacterium]
MEFNYHRSKHSELDMTPLVSVIFLLIIFFLVIMGALIRIDGV